MKNITFNNLICLAWVILIPLLTSCSQPEGESEKEEHTEGTKVELTQAQRDLAAITIGKIEKRTIGSELRVSGIIDVPPQSNISINLPYGGFVKYTEMLPGTRVRKGQFLVAIENPQFIQFQQEYLEGLANREYLKADFERQSSLYDEKVASGKSFQQAKSAYLSNEAKIKSMEARLKLIGFDLSQVQAGNISAGVRIYSPESGSIREVFTNVGKYVGPQDAIMNITNSEDLHVELSVFEDDIPMVAKGQRIRFSLANSPDNWREAEVFLVGSGVREDRTVTVHGHLKEESADLLPGMYVSARIETGSHAVWAAPDESIVRFGGKHFVFAFLEKSTENDQPIYVYDMVEVIKGISEDGYTEVSLADSSLNVNAINLVTRGAFTLLAKSKNSEEEGHGH